MFRWLLNRKAEREAAEAAHAKRREERKAEYAREWKEACKKAEELKDLIYERGFQVCQEVEYLGTKMWIMKVFVEPNHSWDSWTHECHVYKNENGTYQMNKRIDLNFIGPDGDLKEVSVYPEHWDMIFVEYD